MEVYKVKKHFGMTEDQAVGLAEASEIRGRPEAHLMREYISKGTQEDLASWEAAQAPKTGGDDE